MTTVSAIPNVLLHDGEWHELIGSPLFLFFRLGALDRVHALGNIFPSQRFHGEIYQITRGRLYLMGQRAGFDEELPPPLVSWGAEGFVAEDLPMGELGLRESFPQCARPVFVHWFTGTLSGGALGRVMDKAFRIEIVRGQFRGIKFLPTLKPRR